MSSWLEREGESHPTPQFFIIYYRRPIPPAKVQVASCPYLHYLRIVHTVLTSLPTSTHVALGLVDAYGDVLQVVV